ALATTWTAATPTTPTPVDSPVNFWKFRVGVLRHQGHQHLGVQSMSDTEAKVVPTVGELLKDSPKNWGKWGPDDELGSLNYLTPEVIAKAAGSIKSGKVFTLQVKMANPEGDPVWPGRTGATRMNVMDEGYYIAGKGPQFAGGAHYADDFMTC